MNFKDILKVTIVDSKKSIKLLTDKQLESMCNKLNRFLEIAYTELDNRNELNETEEDEA